MRGGSGPDAEWAAANPWLLATVPAAGTFAAVLTLRLAALGAGIDGPWSSPPETALDVSFRAGAVLLAVGLFGARR